MHIHWHQDPLRRVIEIRGEIDESLDRHLSRSVVNLGRRDLVIDLSECTISQPHYEAFRQLEQRLGSRTLQVLVKTATPDTVEHQEAPSDRRSVECPAPSETSPPFQTR